MNKYDDNIRFYSSRDLVPAGMDRKGAFAVVKAIIRVESNFRPGVGSSAGAIGLMQLIPSTYAEMRWGADWKDHMGNKAGLVSNLRNPGINIKYGTKYYSKLHRMYSGNMVLALAAYNWGLGNVSKAVGRIGKDRADVTWEDRRNYLPTETRNYLPKVEKYYIKYGGTSILNTRAATDPIVPSVVQPEPTAEEDISDAQRTPTTPVVYGESTSPDYFKVGDVVLTIPPQAINVRESNSVYTFPAVRTKGSPKLRTGEANLLITVDCMFPSLREINGYWDGLLWYGGLRSMVAQYYCAPFLPLENPTIRDILLPTPTMPEEGAWSPSPNLINTLVSTVDVLEDIMGDIDDSQDNSTIRDYIGHQITVTKETKVAVEASYQKEMSRKDTEGDGTWGGVVDTPNNTQGDSTIAVVLDTMNISTVPGYPKSLRATFTLLPFNYIPFSNSFGFVRTEKDATTQAEEYNALTLDPSMQVTSITPTFDISESEPYRKYYRALLSEFQDGAYHPVYQLGPGTNTLDTMTGEGDVVLTYSYTTDTRLGVLQREAAAARMELAAIKEMSGKQGEYDPPNWFFERWWRLMTAVFAMAASTIGDIDTLIRQRLGMESADTLLYDPIDMRYEDAVKYIEEHVGKENYDKFITLFDDIATAILATQDIGHMAVQTVHLGGPGTVVNGITATYRNKVAPIKLTGQDYPTFQYMGSSDMEFSISVQTTDEELLSAIRLLSINANYTQLLHNNITEGSLAEDVDTSATITGDIFQFLGVGQVIVTNVEYSTVQDKPGLYSIQISCVQADMDLSKYEVLVGGKIVDRELMELAVDELTSGRIAADGTPKWEPGSPWSRYSLSLIIAKNTMEQVERKFKVSKELLSEAEKDLADGMALIEGPDPDMPWWRRLLASIYGFGAWALQRGLDIGRLGVVVWEADLIKAGAMSIHESRMGIIDSLSTPAVARTFNVPAIQRMIQEKKERYDETGRMNQCYADLRLPAITGDAMDTPADFFYKRTDVITSDTIAEEMAVISKYEKTRLEQAFLMNFDSASEEWELLDDRIQAELRTIRDGIPYANMDALLGAFDKYKATAPQHVIDVMKTVYSGALVTALETRLVGMRDSRSTYEDGLRNSDRLLGPTKEKVIDGLLAKFDAEVSHVESMIADRKGPNGILLTDMNQGTVRASSDYGWWGNASAYVDEAYIKANALQTRKLDQTLQMARAYPAYKLYFIEEDAEEWLLFDDFYSYSAVKSIDIVKSRKAASDTAVIVVSNVTGGLTNPIADHAREDISAGGLVEEQRVDRMMLRVGCPVMIRLGYSDDPSVVT